MSRFVLNWNLAEIMEHRGLSPDSVAMLTGLSPALPYRLMKRGGLEESHRIKPVTLRLLCEGCGCLPGDFISLPGERPNYDRLVRFTTATMPSSEQVKQSAAGEILFEFPVEIWRVQAGLHPSELMQAIGYSRNGIYKLLQKQFLKAPDFVKVKTLKGLCDAFKCKPGDLLKIPQEQSHIN